MRKINGVLIMILAVFVLLCLVDRRTTALADEDELPAMTARWWQLMFSIPSGRKVNVNPINDTVGTNCLVGQRGPTWFLGGSLTPSPVTRSCSVPSGEALFFPVINASNINTPGVCRQENRDLSVDELRAQIAPFIDGATKVLAEVDRKPVTNIVRVQSNVFAVALPAENISSIQCNETILKGIYSPAVDDGLYVLLQPLGVGLHTIHVHAEVPNPPKPNFVQDITYNLSVKAIQSR
jgi:hypothetical protein